MMNANQQHSYGGFLSHRGTPSHHPFLDGIFHETNHPYWDPPCMEPPISITLRGGSAVRLDAGVSGVGGAGPYRWGLGRGYREILGHGGTPIAMGVPPHSWLV